MLALRELESGGGALVCALVVDGRCHVVDFIDGLPERTQRHILATLAMVADVGWKLRNEARFKHLRGDVYQVKEHSSNVRLFCFLHQGRLVVCTHGMQKPSGNKAYNKEIEKVQRFHSQCITERIL